MKIVITGGAGFIGSHLCKNLLDGGHTVICIDNLVSGSKKNLVEFEGNPNFTFIDHDICQPLDKLDGLDELSAIFHFACPASPNPRSPVSYLKFPIETLMVSTLGSQHMLELARKNDCQIIFASTSEVYGDPLVHPQPESYWGNVSPNGIRSCYDEGKRAMEALAYAYHRQHGVKIKVIRIFNTYGPGMRLDDGRFTIDLVNSYVNKKPFTVHGDGSATRSFCYVDDLVSGIIKIFESSQAVGEVINLGNPTELSLKDAIAIFEEIVGGEIDMLHIDPQPDDPKRRCPDITKAKNILSWTPTTDFKTGIKKTLDYYSSRTT